MQSNHGMVARRQFLWLSGAALGLAIAAASAWAHDDGRGQKWVASWAASAHGPYPSGNEVAQPDLSFAFGTPASALGNDTANPAADVDSDDERKTINACIRSAGILESVADMDAATVDPSTGSMRAQFPANSALGTIDHLHPNRAGYLSMAKTIDLRVLAPPGRGHGGHDD
ncbi:MAG: hypothetical protein ACXWLR_16220 [Myxococcales bacterium]